MPDVGTLAWQGLFAPAGTPKEVLDTLFKAIVEASNGRPQLQEGFAKQLRPPSEEEAERIANDEAQSWLERRACGLAQDHRRGEARPRQLS